MTTILCIIIDSYVFRIIIGKRNEVGSKKEMRQVVKHLERSDKVLRCVSVVYAKIQQGVSIKIQLEKSTINSYNSG